MLNFYFVQDNFNRNVLHGTVHFYNWWTLILSMVTSRIRNRLFVFIQFRSNFQFDYTGVGHTCNISNSNLSTWECICTRKITSKSIEEEMEHILRCMYIKMTDRRVHGAIFYRRKNSNLNFMHIIKWRRIVYPMMIEYLVHCACKHCLHLQRKLLTFHVNDANMTHTKIKLCDQWIESNVLSQVSNGEKTSVHEFAFAFTIINNIYLLNIVAKFTWKFQFT